MVKAAALDPQMMFAAVPDLDQADLPAIDAWLETEGLRQAFAA